MAQPWQKLAVGLGVLAAGMVFSLPFRQSVAPSPQPVGARPDDLTLRQTESTSNGPVAAQVSVPPPPTAPQAPREEPRQLADPLQRVTVDPPRMSDSFQAAVGNRVETAPPRLPTMPAMSGQAANSQRNHDPARPRTSSDRMWQVAEPPVSRQIPGRPAAPRDTVAQPTVATQPQIPPRTPPKRQYQNRPAAPQYHRVVDGDNLQKLAQRYLGDTSRAQEIYELNRDVLRHPELLPINARLRMPASLVPAPPARVDNLSDRLVPVR